MSSVNGMGQAIFQNYQAINAAAVASAQTARQVTDSDPDGHRSGGENAVAKLSPVGSALLITLQHFGIDPKQFQHQFLAALSGVKIGQSSDIGAGLASQRMVHLNTVG